MESVLVAALLLFAPRYLDRETATQHVQAALAAGKRTGVDPVLLLALAYVESRYSPFSLSRIQCSKRRCRRVTGEWSSTLPPRGAKPTWYCGVTQVGGKVSWKECLALRDVRYNYLVGARHLVRWSKDAYCRGNVDEDLLRCALRGYNGGYPAIRKKAVWYATRVMTLAAFINRSLERS